MITDHPFRPCFYARSEATLNSAMAIVGMCRCPAGPRRCHAIGCGKLRQEHVVCCEENDVSCPTHGTKIGQDIAR